MTATRTRADIEPTQARSSPECNRFFLLADPTRLKILGALRDGHGEISVGRLCGQLKLAQPHVSHHLQKLKFAGMVTSEKRTREVFYKLDPVVFADIAAFVEALASP